MNHPSPAPEQTLPRRTFIATAAIGSFSLGLMPVPIGVHAGETDTLKVGMIGCGGRNAGAAVQALTADRGATLVAMGDIFMDRIDAKHREIQAQRPNQVSVPAPRRFVGFDAYKHVIEASDVVLIANAAKFHPWHAMAAIQAGRHVFVEKPHGIDPAGLHLMQQACDLARQKGLSILSGLHSRHHLGYEETVKRIQDGQIGDVITIEENFLRAPYGITERKPGMTELEWQLSTQYHFRWLSGDDVVQSLVHNMDRTSWLLGNAAPVKCHGLGGRSTMTDPVYGDVFDHHGVVYEFQNGIRAYALCRTTTGCYDEDSSLVFGSLGKASIKGCRIWGAKSWKWQGQCDPYQIEHNRLFAAIRSGKPSNSGDYMVKSTMMAVMGQLSCYTGKEISWESIMKSGFYYPPHPRDCVDGMKPPTQPGTDGKYPVPTPGKSDFDLDKVPA